MSEDPTRVVRLVTRLNVGGPARHALLLTRGLEPEYTTTLAAGTPEASEGELTHPDVPIHRVPLVRAVSPRTDARAFVAVRSLLRTVRPQLLHTHMAKAGTVGRLAARTLARDRPRTIHTFHGHVLEGYFSAPIERAFVEAERALARRTDAIVVVSEEIRDELSDLRIGRPEQYRVIKLGLELEPFLAVDRPSGALRAGLAVGSDTPLVGVVGRLVPIKDHITLLDAVEQVPGCHLAVLGDGELREQLEREVRTRGLADRVHFLGWWADMASAVADLDVVVLTSRNEGTPVALIEAAAAGRPSVATDVGGVRTVVLDGTTGLLAAAGDAAAIATHLRALLQDPARRARMGAAGREHVRDRFGEARLLRDVRALYADLLSGPGGRRR